MQMIIKSNGLHIDVDLKDHKQAVNLKWMCEMLGINYSTVTGSINRDGLTVDQAVKKALNNVGGV